LSERGFNRGPLSRSDLLKDIAIHSRNVDSRWSETQLPTFPLLYTIVPKAAFFIRLIVGLTDPKLRWGSFLRGLDTIQFGIF
jgi:hypothetical protein